MAEFHKSVRHSVRRDHLPAAPSEIRVQRRAHRYFVVHHENLAQRVSPKIGNRIENVLPLCSKLWTLISPPCCSITFLQTDKPNPGLPAFVVNPGSNIFSTEAASIPHPRS